MVANFVNLSNELKNNFDENGNSFYYLWVIGSGVERKSDAAKIRAIAKKHGYKAIVRTSTILSISFMEVK